MFLNSQAQLENSWILVFTHWPAREEQCDEENRMLWDWESISKSLIPERKSMRTSNSFLLTNKHQHISKDISLLHLFNKNLLSICHAFRRWVNKTQKVLLVCRLQSNQMECGWSSTAGLKEGDYVREMPVPDYEGPYRPKESLWVIF